VVVKGILPVIVVLAACTPAIVTGTVVDKQFVASHSETRHRSESQIGCGFGIGSDGDYDYGCGRIVQVDVAYQVTVPDAWYIVVHGCPDDNCHTERHAVTQAAYDQWELGDTWHK